MSIGPQTHLFFDASCLIAAAGSPSGGSGFLLSLCAKGLLQGAVSQPVLLEAERNVRKKLAPAALDTYHRLIVLTPLVLVAVPAEQERVRYREAVGEKDEHVLAAVVMAAAPFLLTLDQPLAERVNAGGFGIEALSPGTFIKQALPQHVDYPSIRE